MDLDADVLIVGGGPAGSAAAIWCVQRGLQVTLIEGARFPREAPGETLHPGAEVIFDSLGVGAEIRAAGFLRHQGNWVEWGASRRFVPFGSDENGPWLGFQALRADLDQILLEHARTNGVKIVQPCRAIDLIQEGGVVHGAVTTNGPFRARHTIDASGGRHWLARKASLAIERFSPPLHARYGYVRGERPEPGLSPSITGCADGWTWTARIQEGFHQWTRLSVRNEPISTRWLPDDLLGLTPVCSAGADVTWRKVSPAAGPGYFLVGDAAAVLDPLSSHGVLRGMMSGIQAAETILQVGNPSDYDRWLSDWVAVDVMRLRELYVEAGIQWSAAASGG